MPDRDGKATEEIADGILTSQIKVMRGETPAVRDILRILRELEREVIARIVATDPTDPVRVQNRLRRLDSLLREVRQLAREHYRRARDRQTRHMTGVVVDVNGETRELLNDTLRGTDEAVIAGGVLADRIPQIVDNSLVEGAPHGEWWSRQASGFVQQFQDQMRIGLVAGEPISTLIRRIQGGVVDGVLQAGIGRMTQTSAERIVRTSTLAVANNTRMAVFERNSEIVERMIHVSTLDSRTSIQCIARDDKQWDMQTKEPIGHSIPFAVPPIHWNCRSTLAPLIIGAPKTAPVKKTFDAWLSAKSETQQNEILGASRAQLWRTGRVSLGRLLDFRGQPMTVAQLKAR